MSGHSKWKTIKHAKGLKDAKRGSEFTKISKEISIAAQLGGGSDPEFNYLLRIPVEKARAANMTNDTIEKAIKRGLGLLKDEKIIYANSYEVYAPDGTALIIDTSTDNPTRTISEIKNVVLKNGGKVLNEGSISWKFKEVGRIVFDPIDYSKVEEDFVIKLIDRAPIEDIDVLDDDQRKLVYLTVKKENLKFTTDTIVNLFPEAKIIEAEIMKLPDNYSHQTTEALEDFIAKIEELDDIDKVWSDAN